MFKRIVLKCVVMSLCLGVDAYAISMIGPPTATHKPLQISLGLEQYHSEENLGFEDHGVTGVETLKDVRRNMLVGKLGVGLTEYLELILCFGSATLRANELHFDDRTNPLWGGGTRVTIYRSDKIDLGASFQWTTVVGEESGYMDAAGFYAWEQIIVDEQHFAIGPTMQMDGWRLYGGPFYYVLDADVTIKESVNPRNQIRPDLEEESEFGGFIGGQFDLGAEGHLTIEYANTSEGWGLGIGFSRKF